MDVAAASNAMATMMVAMMAAMVVVVDTTLVVAATAVAVVAAMQTVVASLAVVVAVAATMVSLFGSVNRGNQTQSSLPPSPVEQYKNWNYCFKHGGDINNNHISTTCACPSENHQRAVTRSNIVYGNMRYMNKTILPSTVDRCPAPTCSPPLPLNYTPTFSFPMGTNGPQFPTAPGSWGFGPHAGA